MHLPHAHKQFLAISLPAHIALSLTHPVYRNLTVQFKIFLQLSALTLGGYIWAEKRVSEYNEVQRRRIRGSLERSRRAWDEESEVKERVRVLMEAKGKEG